MYSDSVGKLSESSIAEILHTAHYYNFPQITRKVKRKEKKKKKREKRVRRKELISFLPVAFLFL